MSILSSAIGLSARALPIGILGMSGVSGYKEKAKRMNPLLAGAYEAGQQAFWFMLNPATAMTLGLGLPLAKVAGTLAGNKIRNTSMQVRQSRTPFSHRYEHSEVAARAQAIGLQAITGSYGYSAQGSEAALFARRYGR